MVTYGEWRAIKSLCINCDYGLEARPVFGYGPIISGAEPMEYRHSGENGGCNRPQVYSCWNKLKEWEESKIDMEGGA